MDNINSERKQDIKSKKSSHNIMFLGCFQGDGFSATAETKEELDQIMTKYIQSKHPEVGKIVYLINEIDDNDFSNRDVKTG